MCDPLTLGLAVGGLSAVSSFMASQQQAASQRYQASMAGYEADVAANNALAMKQQADVERQKGQIAQAGVDREHSALRRQYEAEAGANRSLMAAGNVDISSGSALDSLMGNAYLFADDMAANRYSHAVTGWEAGERARQAEYQSAQYAHQSQVSSANAGWLQKSAGNTGTSLLTAGLAGVGGGLSGYSMAGGSFGNMLGAGTSGLGAVSKAAAAVKKTAGYVR